MQAFQKLLVQEAVAMKLCIFVDGLDEYSGLSSDIARLFNNAAQAPSVKVCVSSRPLLVFKERFASQQQLRLEDLTKGDIERYVVDKLKNDERMQMRHDKEAVKMQELTSEVVGSASGVFLWVKLIVVDLLKGLENHDSVSLLQERLRLLPTDLEELYEHMVFKVDSIYRVEASRLYQLIAATAERDDDWRPVQQLTIFTLFLAEEDKDLALKSAPMFLSMEAIIDGICATDLKLRSRCGGLLETKFGKSSIKDLAPDMNVTYIHRTVKDYLEGTGIRHILSDRTGGLSPDAFNPHLALMRAYILQLKALECVSSNMDRAEQLINDVVSYARRVELDICQPNTELLDSFFQTSTSWWHQANDTASTTRECILLDESLITLSIRCGLHEFLKARLLSTDTLADARMLNRALCPALREHKFVSIVLVETLLELGANPNQEINDAPARVIWKPQSPWQNAITYLAVGFPFIVTDKSADKQALLNRWERILKLLLQNGAKTSVSCRGPLVRSRAQALQPGHGQEKRDSATAHELKPGFRLVGDENNVIAETVVTPREVIQKTFEKRPDMLAGLLRLLDAKTAVASSDQISKMEIPKESRIGRVKRLFRAGNIS